MKKIAALVLAVVLVLALAGCGKVEVVNGSWDGKVFTNASTNVKLSVPDDFSVYSAENAAEVAAAQAEYVDAIAINPNTGSNIIVSLIPAEVSNGKAYMMQTGEELAKSGCTVSEVTGVKMCGETYYELDVERSDGTPQYYYGRVLGDKLVCIIITVGDGEDAQTYVDMLDKAK